MGFGKPFGGMGREPRNAALLADPARLELIDVGMLRREAAGAALAACQGSPEARTAKLLHQAALYREIARRTGEPEALAKAASAAERAAQLAGADNRRVGAARLEQAQCSLLASELFSDLAGQKAAAERLEEAEEALGCPRGRLNGPGLVRARLQAREALAAGDRRAGLEAADCFHEASVELEARVRATGGGQVEAAAARCERGELLIGLGLKLKEAALLDRAARELGRLAAALDRARLPLSWARAEILRGGALRALGEVTGEARLLADAAAALASAADEIPSGHSPLDRARAGHGLGLAMQILAEATGETKLYVAALQAFDRSLAELGAAPGLSLRAVAIHDRAACLARQAERKGDARALAEAEAAFKSELEARSGREDPVGWAVTQVALARVYEARAALLGDAGERADAAFALAEALEVFRERGLKSLAEIATSALNRLKRLA